MDKDYQSLYYKYGCKTIKEIQTYLKHIKIVKMRDNKYYPFDMSSIIEKPRNVSFTFSIFNADEKCLDLTIYKIVPFLCKSSSRFFLKPDIGEVFDQIENSDINQISAIYVNEEIYKAINVEGDHFLMEAVLLNNIKQIRKKKLNKLNKL